MGHHPITFVAKPATIWVSAPNISMPEIQTFKTSGVLKFGLLSVTDPANL